MATAAMELKVLISILQSGTVLPAMLKQVDQLSKGLTDLQKKSKEYTPPKPPPPPDQSGLEHLRNLDAAANKLIGTLKFLAGGFLALESVRFLKDLADTAARAEVLSTVLHVVGNNAGYSTAALDKADRQIQSLGITAQAARQSLTQFIQAELDLADAPKLARAAQDAAVILGTDSSDAFERLVTAVQTSNTMMLRHMGIIVSADTAYQRYATSIGKSASQLTSAQRAQAFLNATLEQTQRIQGSYVNAMGDVGKQLTSLERLTTNLKTSLGNQLLPAYLAIVEELTLFLQNVGLAADEMYGQGEGAKKLGEDIRVLASNFRILVEGIIRHRKEILVIVGLWALLSKIAIPLIAIVIKLIDALAGDASAGALGLIVSRIGLLATGLIGLGIVLISMAVYWERFNAAVGTGVGAVWTLLEVLDTIMYAVAGGVMDAFRTLFNFIAHPLSPSEWLKPWKDWADGVVERINYVKTVWENTKARFKQAIGDDPAQATAEQQAQAARASRFAEEAALLAEIMTKTREYNELKKTGSAQALETVGKELSTLKTKAAAMTEARKAEQDAMKMGTAMRENEDKRLAAAVKLNLETAQTRKLEDARRGAKFTYGVGGEVGIQFSTQLGQFNDLLDIYNSEGGKAKVTTQELTRALLESSALTKTRAEYDALKLAVQDLNKAGADTASLRRANIALQTAAVQVREETQREAATIERLRSAHFAELEKRRATHLDNELSALRTANELQEDIDQSSYNRRGLDLDEYFDRRAARMKTESDKEVAIAENRLAALERKKAANIPKSPEDIEALDTQIDEARAALQLLVGEQGTIATRTAKLALEREDARNEKLQKSRQTLLDIQAIYGEEVDALAAVNNKFDEQYARANTAEERAAIQAERRREIFATELKFRERSLELSLIEQKQNQEALSLAQSRLGLARQRVTDRENMGEITSIEAMRQRNAIQRQQNDLNEQLRRSKSLELERLQVALLREEQKIREDMVGQSDEAIRLRIRTDLESRRQQIQGLTTDIDALNLELEDSAVKMESYGKTIRESFVNSFSDALTQTIMNVKKASDIWKQMAQSITSEIVSIITKGFAQQLAAQVTKLGMMALGSIGSMGGGGSGSGPIQGSQGTPLIGGMAGGGPVFGPGTGTSDSILARVSAGEHIMPADKAAQWLPLLEGIRTGTIQAFASGGFVQSIAMNSVIPRRYASGGIVVSDGGAASVTPAGGGGGHMVVSLHPDAMNMTLREWLEHEVVRQQGRR